MSCVNGYIFCNALSDGEVEFDINMILVAQNAVDWNYLRVEIPEIRSRHRKRYEKVVGIGISPLVHISALPECQAY